MSSWLIIGASSFTGTNFCQYLENLGENVEEGHARNPGLKFVVQANFDHIVNFAAANVVAPSWDHPGDYCEANLVSPLPWWRAMANSKSLKRYVHISTPEIYGSTSNWITEDTPFNPSTPYAVSRAAAEMMLRCYHKQYKLPVIFTRGCNVYGPGQQLHRLIPKLVVSIKRGWRFPLEGGGLSARAFLHVNDVCRAIYTIATKGDVGEAYHISSVELYTIRGLVEMICARMGVRLADAVEEAPERPGKDAAYKLVATKLRKLGWKEQIGMMEGIEQMIDWASRNHEGISELHQSALEYKYI